MSCVAVVERLVEIFRRFDVHRRVEQGQQQPLFLAMVSFRQVERTVVCLHVE